MFYFTKTTIIFLLLFLISNFGFAQSNSEILTNESIVKLCSSGLSSNVIIAKIKKSKTNFKTETTDLVKLKEQKVSDEVIEVMIDPTNNLNTNEKVKAIGSENKVSGIYLLNTNDKSETQLETHHSSSGKMLITATTYLEGLTAKITTNEEKPVFYFYFDKNTKNS